MGWRGQVSDGGRRWLAIARLAPCAGRTLVALAVAVNVAVGLLPLAFVVASSVMLDRLRVVAGSGGGISSAVTWAFAAAFAALLVQYGLAPAQSAVGELVTRRVDGACARRLVNVTLADAPLALLERQDVLDRLSEARAGLVERDLTPGSAVAGLFALIGRYTQLIGAITLVALVLGPLAGVVVAGCALVARVGNRGSLSRWATVMRGLVARRRKLRYLADTGSDATLAKEVRVLGILPWWRSRTRTEAADYLRPMWIQRRRIYFAPFLALSAVVLAGAVMVMYQLRAAAGAPDFSVLELSLAIQAIGIPLRFGAFFPECDVQTLYGMHAYEALVELELLFAAGRADDPGGPVLAGGMPRDAIRFEGVRFSYPDAADRPVLAGLDLELIAGRSTAIVGLNGAGKTTLIKLLAGLYTPDAGRILVDGVDLRGLDRQSWRQRLAVIFQDFVRYEWDAAANIGVGAHRLLADRAALLATAARADAGEVLARLPAGLDTPLSSRYPGGVDLSGGQWQRVALARALFAVQGGASVLVLDEPTAHLDVRAEAAFIDRFLELASGLTAVVISHRFSTVRRADHIVVLAEGRVAEQGTHDELLARGGRYADLFQLQARRFAEWAPS